MATINELVNRAQAKIAFDSWRLYWEENNHVLVDPSAAWDAFVAAYETGYKAGYEANE